ncbi:MAG: phosphoribosylanthranilate isomerase [Bryobacteraceae bacterium]
MMVKICGITNREDAQAAADAGATAIGFNFYRGSSRYIQPRQAAEISAAVNLTKVGVFVNESPAEIERIVQLAGLDVIQLHGDESPQAANQHTGRVWKAFRVTESWTAGILDSYTAEAFLLDAPSNGSYGGSGTAFDWKRANGIQRNIILAGGLDATNVGAAIQAVLPWGVDSCSRLEISPGRKDHDKMRRFIEAALTESI